MSTIPDYISWRGDISLEQVPYNEVDAYILTRVNTVDLTGIVAAGSEGISLKDALGRYFCRTDIDPDALGRFNQPVLTKTLRQLPQTRRFEDVILSDYFQIFNEEQTEQVSGMTLTLPGGPTMVTLRGTDDTIIGWKENFLMAIKSPVRAQEDALAYLEHIAETHDGPLVVLGHSKGGNLAVYSSVMASEAVQDRITAVYNFDGPGFREEFWHNPGVERIQSRMHNYVSQDTMVGTLLKQSDDLIICKSDRTGPLAHEAMYWEVMGPCFVREEKLSSFSVKFDRLMDQKIRQMTNEELTVFIEEFFGVLTSTGAATLTDLSAQTLEQLRHLIRQIYGAASVKEFGRDLIRLILQDRIHAVR